METRTSQLHLGLTLAQLTIHRLLMRKSTWFLALVGLAPNMILLFWLMGPEGLTTKPYGIYKYVASYFYMVFYTPILAIFLGLGTISDEVETKNITFTLTRPLSMPTIVIARFASHFIVALVLLSLGLTSTFLSNMVFQFEHLFTKLPDLLNQIFVMGYGLLGYLAVIAAFGTLFRKFAIPLSVLWLVIDTLFSITPVNNLLAISVKYRMMAGYWEQLPSFGVSLAAVQTSPAFVHALVLLVVAVVACGAMIFRFQRFELVLTDSGK